MGKPTLFYTYTDLILSVFSMKLKQIKPKAIFPPLWISLTFKLLQLNASSWYVKIKLWIPHIKSLWSTRLWENYCLISFSFISLIVGTVILAICSLLLIEALYEILYPLMQDFKATMWGCEVTKKVHKKTLGYRQCLGQQCRNVPNSLAVSLAKKGAEIAVT